MSIKIAIGLVAAALGIAACGEPDRPSTFDPAPKAKSGGANGLGEVGGASGSTPPDFAKCATKTAVAEAKDVYLVFMFDRSGSMVANDSPKWSSATAASKSFFASPGSAGVHASLAFFPNDLDYSCNANDYAAPLVPMSALPSAAFGATLDQRTPELDGPTPTYVALYGAILTAQSIAAGEGKDGKVAVVLVTDGLPDSTCDGNSVADVKGLAASVAATFPTYVIGVGDQLSRLKDIAEGGGTNDAPIVKTSDAGKIQSDFLQAIDSIRSALACDYEIPPPPPGDQLDRDLVNVVHRVGGKADALSRNPSCTGGSGWRYDDANDPKRIVLCDASCQDVKTNVGSVEVLFGCATKSGDVR
jgi:hypothetical protein